MLCEREVPDETKLCHSINPNLTRAYPNSVPLACRPLPLLLMDTKSSLAALPPTSPRNRPHRKRFSVTRLSTDSTATLPAYLRSEISPDDRPPDYPESADRSRRRHRQFHFRRHPPSTRLTQFSSAPHTQKTPHRLTNRVISGGSLPRLSTRPQRTCP